MNKQLLRYSAQGNSSPALATVLAVAILGLLLVPTIAWAQADSINLDQLLAYARTNNPAIRAGYERYRAGLNQANLAGGLPDPVIGVGEFIENVETRVGPQERRFSIQQSFPWFGSLGAKRTSAYQKSEQDYQAYLSDVNQVVYSVRAAYYDYFLLEKEIELTAHNIELLKFWESVVTTRYKVGVASHPDLIKAQVELGKLEDQRASLQQERRPVLARLETASNMTGLDRVAIIPISDSALTLLPLNDDSVMAAVLDHNPNIAGLDHLIASSEANISAASRENLPKISLGFDYIQTGAALVPTMKDSGKDPIMVSVGLSVPLWFGKNKARTESARALNRAAVYQKEAATNQLRAYTQQALFDYADALRQFNLYRDDLTHRAEMALDVSYTAYENGKVEFISLLDAQRQLLSFQWQLEQAVTKGLKTKAKLDMLSGQGSLAMTKTE